MLLICCRCDGINRVSNYASSRRTSEEMRHRFSRWALCEQQINYVSIYTCHQARVSHCQPPMEAGLGGGTINSFGDILFHQLLSLEIRLICVARASHTWKGVNWTTFATRFIHLA